MKFLGIRKEFTSGARIVELVQLNTLNSSAEQLSLKEYRDR